MYIHREIYPHLGSFLRHYLYSFFNIANSILSFEVHNKGNILICAIAFENIGRRFIDLNIPTDHGGTY